MRVIFSSTPEHSHLAPLLPLAIECRARGHEVLVACCPSLGAVAAELGLEWASAGIDLDPDRLTASDLDLEPPPADMTPETMNAWAFGRVFVDVFARRMTPDLLAIAERFRPDLMVRDCGEFAAWIVGERVGATVATVTFGCPLDLAQDVAYGGTELAALRESQGLGPDPGLETMLRGPVLVPAPASYALAAGPPSASASFVRPLVHDARPGERLPDWVADLGARPVVLVTLGNIFNDEESFRTLVAAVGDEPYDVVMTVGRSVEPDALEPWPANVRVERYVPQSLLLPRVDAVMCHGGYNTVIGALAEGRPLVVAPMGADQPEHAARCDALGAGLVVSGVPLVADEVRAAIRRVLEDPSYRRAAEALAAEIAALPDVGAAVTILERAAARAGRPLDVHD